MLLKQHKYYSAVVIIVLNLIFFLSFTAMLRETSEDRFAGFFAFNSGDTFSYIGAMENYISTGKYFFHNGNREVYAGRMPHYSIPYYLFRQIFLPPISKDLVVLMQLVLHMVSCYLLGKVAFLMTNNRIPQYSVIILYSIFGYTSRFIPFLFTESLSISFLIITFYYFFKYHLYKKKKDFFMTSVFLGLTCILKVYFLPLYGFIFLYELFSLKWNLFTLFKTRMIDGLLFLIPLLILIAPWVIRNQLILNKFIPLQENQFAGYDYSEADLEVRKFIRLTGEDITYWEPNSMGCYFRKSPPIPCNYKLPDHILKKPSFYSSLDIGRDLYFQLQVEKTDSLNELVKEYFSELRNTYKKDFPFRQYINRVSIMKDFFFHSGSFYIQSNVNNITKPLFLVFKIVQSLLYFIVLISGIVGLVFISTLNRLYGVFLFTIPLLILLLFPLYYGTSEVRYSAHIFPFLILSANSLLSKLFINRIFKLK